MRIHHLLACAATAAATAVLPADLVIPMGGSTNIGAATQSYGNVTCDGTLEMTYPAMVDASGMVMLGGNCTLMYDVPMGTMLPMTIVVIDNMGMMNPSGMFMGLPEGAMVMLGGMTYYIDYMGGDGNDVVLSTMMPTMMPPMMPMPTMMPRAGTNVQDMWWSPSQNGWGMSLITHGDTVFAALYVYDDAGLPRWYVMPASSWDMTHTILTGAIYMPTSSPFFAYDASRLKAGSPVGSVTITFQDYNDAILDYAIDGMSGRRLVTREMFGSGDTLLHDHSDLWWGGSAQNGWGITIRQQQSTLFNVWYTYDANGNPVWYAMPGGAWTSGTTYQGHAYRTASSPWRSGYDQAKLQVQDAGTYRIDFNGDAATFTYDVDGHNGTIPLVKEPF